MIGKGTKYVQMIILEGFQVRILFLSMGNFPLVLYAVFAISV